MSGISDETNQWMLRKVTDLSRRATVSLAGGYMAELTAEERNAWNEFVLQTPIWKLYQKITFDETVAHARLNLMATDACIEELRVIYHERVGLERQLYDVAKTWYAGLRAGEAK